MLASSPTPTPPEHPPAGPAPIRSLSGSDIHHMFGAGYAWLKQHSHIVNALNVFPVPDGDTGTNMVLTMQAAWKAAADSINASAADVVQAFANGAIRGARGNSGVIFSQILRGMAQQLKGAEALDAPDFAAALRQARETAYKGVLKPVEGTILTVIREAADASSHAAAINSDLRFVLETALAKAHQALQNTPNLLPVLKQAGVVDAGGQGLFYFFEGMAKYLRGEHLLQPDQITAAATPALPQPDLAALGEEEWGYDIQYLVYGDDLDEAAIRQQLLELGGDSVVVGRAGRVVKVHVHHTDPGPFLTFGASLGQLDDIVLENMTLQTLRRKGEWQEDGPVAAAASARSAEITAQPHPGALLTPDCLGIVAVVSGEGMRKIFESLGVCAIVTGGQTMNPSTEEILHAAESLPQEEVIILPNNKNIILAARQAAELSAKTLHVIETRTVPQGIAAMLGYHATASPAENAQTMAAAAQAVHTAEITTAVREAAIGDVTTRVGDIIGIVDGILCCKGADVETVMIDVLRRLEAGGETELFTLYYGEPVTAEEAEALTEHLQTLFPDQEFELLHGGQPHYHYLLSAE